MGSLTYSLQRPDEVCVIILIPIERWKKKSFEKLNRQPQIIQIVSRELGFKSRQLDLAGTFNYSAVILQIHRYDHVLKLKNKLMFTCENEYVNLKQRKMSFIKLTENLKNVNIQCWRGWIAKDILKKELQLDNLCQES